MCVAYTYKPMLTYCEVPVSAEQYFSVISCLDSATGGAHMISCKKSFGPSHLIILVLQIYLKIKVILLYKLVQLTLILLGELVSNFGDMLVSKHFILVLISVKN